MFDFPLAILLVVTASTAAFIGLVLVVAFAKDGPEDVEKIRAADPVGQTGVVFFFDGLDLVDATAEAMQIIRRSDGGTASGWRNFLSALAPRFPQLEQELKSLGDVGTLTLLSAVDDAGKAAPVALIASRQGGLTRVQLHDGARENRSLVVDPVSWQLLNEELEILRRVTFRMNGPCWVEDAEAKVIWANPAYLGLLERKSGDDQNLPWPLPALFPSAADGPQTAAAARVSLSINGAVSWFEMRSHLSPSGGHARFAEPIDALHWAETSLRDFVQTLSKTFSQLPIGLAVFDRNRMLHMFNPALAQLTGLPVEFLAARPRLSAVLDALRDLNRLPEPKNYQNWRRELIQMERAAATGAYEDVWNLSDGLSFRVTARPHPDGAIALMIEDITPEMQRSQRYHKDMALGNSVIDAIPDPVAVFNSAGELVMDNPAFAVFGMPGSEPDTDPPQNADVEPASAAIEIVHIRDVANRLSSQTAPTPFWKQLQEFVQTIGDREAWKAQIRLADGRLFNSLVQPLPASATMVLFRAVAVTAPKVRVTEDAKPRQRA